MPEPKNVLPELRDVLVVPLESCLLEPRAGFTTRGGNRETPPRASGSHSVRELAHLNRHAVDCS